MKVTRLKRLERAWKRLWFDAIFAYLDLRSPPPLPDWKRGPRRVLFIRPDGIGDAIVSTRLFRAVAGLSPTVRVDVMGSPANAGLLRRLDVVSEVYVFDKRRRGALLRLATVLRRNGYDIVIDCRITPPSLTGLLLMLISGAKHRAGVAGRGVDRALTVCVPPSDGHIIEQLACFGALFRLSDDELRRAPVLAITEAERLWALGSWEAEEAPGARRLLVNISAGEETRSWPDERFVVTIEALRRRDPTLSVRLIGAPAEWDRVEKVAHGASVTPVATPSFGHAMALVAVADVVFSPDTSIVHVASAFGRPTVAMYLRGTSRQWGAFSVAGANLESEGGTLDSLSSGRVLEALYPLLTETSEEPLNRRHGSESGRAFDSSA